LKKAAAFLFIPFLGWFLVMFTAILLMVIAMSTGGFQVKAIN